MKTINKALKVLSLFLNNKEEMTLSEIAALAKLNKATTNRILITMVKNGYLNQHERRGKYSLGTIFMDFNEVLKRNLKMREIGIPYAIDLNQKVKEASVLSEWNKNTGSLIEIYHAVTCSISPLQVVPSIGSSVPLHCTASGKIVLADMSDEELQKYFDNNLVKHTPKTIVDINEMKTQITKIKIEGVAFDDEEYHLGIKVIAARIDNHLGQLIGTLSILAPSIHFTRRKISEVAPEVIALAMKISQRMGFRENIIQ